MEISSNELKYLAEEISKQNVEGAACFFLAECSKMQKERDKLRKELLNRIVLHDLRKSEPIQNIHILGASLGKCFLKRSPSKCWWKTFC